MLIRIFFALILAVSGMASLNAKPLYFAIISPDLPFSVEEMNGVQGKPGYVEQFTAIIARALGVNQSEIQGRYFQNLAEADAYITQNRDVFIMSSVDYFLSRQQALNLEPLADMVQGGESRYYIVVKTGTYSSLEQLKGKKLAGSVLYGDIRFLEKVVFNGISLQNYFVLKPTQRIYSAVRNLTRGSIDAVLLTQRDYIKFQATPMFSQLSVIYTSTPVSGLGIMMVNTPGNRQMKDRVIMALTGLGGSADASAMLKANGITGFAPVNRTILNDNATRYGR